MEILSMEFLAALAAIIVIDLVLAGDNAIVIALAARNLQPRLRKQAIIWGTFGAIAMRAAMTVIVVWLLRIPGLMLFGGVMLLWIAYRLLVPSEGGGDHEVKAADGFWAAMGTIVVADVMMGLDNVLAVAGAAHGSYLLVVLGLLISIPIVVWGSQLVLKLIDRFPGIVYLGAGVLLLTAAKMITDEPYIKEALGDGASSKAVVCAVLVAGILALAFLRNAFRKQDRLEARLEELATRTQPSPEGRPLRVLLPASGSARTLETVRRLIDEHLPGRDLEVHLLHVRAPMGGLGATLLNRADVASWQQEQGLKKLAPAARLLTERGVAHACHVRVGDRASEIAALTQAVDFDRVIIPSARRNSLTRLLDDRLTGRVLERTAVPVHVLPTPASGGMERIAVPAGLGALALLAALSLD